MKFEYKSELLSLDTLSEKKKISVKELITLHPFLYVFHSVIKPSDFSEDSEILIFDECILIGDDFIFFIYLTLRAFYLKNKNHPLSKEISNLRIEGVYIDRGKKEKNIRFIRLLEYIFSDQDLFNPRGIRLYSFYKRLNPSEEEITNLLEKKITYIF